LSHRNVHACAAPQNSTHAACDAIVRETVNSAGQVVPDATSGPSGYGPSDLQSAYALATAAAANGAGRTVAIVDAYDDPTAAADLSTYRSQYGLPAVSSCVVTSTSVSSSTSGPCFAKVNESGGTSLPTADGGWAQEESLDLDMVSAVCPQCNILLVEASSASFSDLGTAVNTAAARGVAAISNSYGSTGDASDSSYGSYYNHPGIAVTASTGDNGYGVGYPATSDYTVAVGGTSLSRSSSARGWSESAWNGAGSGCSRYQAEPSWQKSAGLTACGATRAIADVSAVADPNTGVAVFDSTAYNGASGWLVFGGTSAASPIIASVYALAGSTGTSTSPAQPAALPYAATSNLNDVTSGSNGICSPAVLCTSTSGWDGPTGLGTPNGVAAFSTSSSSGGGTTAPAAPTGLTATAGSGSVALSWGAVAGAASYNVYRSTSSTVTLSNPVASGVNSTSWTDSSVVGGTTYYYEVTAVDASGTQSSGSNEVSATPTSATAATARVSSITYSLSTNRRTLTVRVNVRNAVGAAISGASVSVSIARNGAGIGTGTGTTSSTGVAQFSVSRPSSGTYVTTVTKLSASGYTWDGVTPANSFTM
jgi:subtilase family serine protease